MQVSWGRSSLSFAGTLLESLTFQGFGALRGAIGQCRHPDVLDMRGDAMMLMLAFASSRTRSLNRNQNHKTVAFPSNLSHRNSRAILWQGS